MPTIDLDLFRTVKNAIENDSDIVNLLAKDSQNHPCIRPANFTMTGAKYPELTIEANESDSDSLFPSTKGMVRLCVWIDSKTQNSNYSFLKNISDRLINLFNREGSLYNSIDIETNTGVRYCQFVKLSRDYNKDDQSKLNYVEIIFEVIYSEDESFDEEDAGDKAWV